jgi:WD40 repeat protein
MLLQGHEGAVWAIAFSKDGKQIASGSDDNTVRVWDAVTGGNIALLKGHDSRIVSVSFTPDGKHIFARDHSGKSLAWNAGEHVHIFADTAIEHIPEHKPSFPKFALDRNSGWLFIKQSAEQPPRRLCWIPVDRRPFRGIRSFNHTVVFAAPTAIITILRISPSARAL